jgi:hypothetical protein
MKVQGAAVSLGGRNFVVVHVGMELVGSPGEADMAIDTMRPSFGGVPVVLMGQNEKGSPTYYGDEDLVRLLAGVPVDEMPWKEYAVG